METEAGAEEPVYSNIVTVARTEQAAPAYAAAQTESADAADRTAPAEADDNAGSRQEAQTRSVTLQKNNSSGDATDDTTGDITDTDGNVSESAANGTTKDKTENDASGTETRPKADDTQDDAADASSTEEDEDTATTLDSQNETVKEQSAFSLEGIISFYDVPADRKPESVTITVYADGEERVSFELNGGRVAKVVSGTLGPGCTVDPAAVGEAWGFSITNLEEQTADGKKITYTIKETVRPDGYTVTYAGGGEYADADNSFTILNVYSEEQELEDARINGTKDKKEKEEEKEDKDTVLEDGTIELYVNGGAKDILLAQRDELFYYTIEAVVPAGAKTFTITDTLDPVLKMYSEADEITVTADGATVPSEGDVRGKLQKTVVLDGQALTVRIPEAEQYEGKKISVRFDAVIRSDMDVSAYASKNGEIPNSAKAEATDGKTQVTTQQSATRYVKMPDEPGVKKTVNNTENYVMETADDTLKYTITARIPLDAVTYTLVDTVSQVIEVKSVSAEIDGKAVASSALTARGQEVSLKINDAYNFTGETVTMHVNARIVEGADLSLFNNYQVPNTVSIFVNGRLYETSAPATVDGNVLGVRRGRVRGGRTGEKRLIVDIVVGAAALVTLIVLLRKRVEF